jgi:hypothetical protein
MVAKELRSGRVLRLDRDSLLSSSLPPYRVDADVLFVAYYASAEMGCHLVLGWPLPERVLDLFTEFRALTNGRTLQQGSGLLGALWYFGLDAMAAIDKDANRALAMRGGPWSADEQRRLLDYCATDVDALERLLRAMLPRLSLPFAYQRGRYMRAAARIEHTGIPIDTHALLSLREAWPSVRQRLVARLDADFGIYDGTTFKQEHFRRWLEKQGIAWPLLDSGQLALDENTFKEMAGLYPQVDPLRQLRDLLSKMRDIRIAVGSDGRNRTLLSAFGAKTGRNTPSTTRSIFGPPSWVRNLIRPTFGQGLAYLDWEQQEFGIAAALSGDNAMLSAYSTGDPYLAFAIQAGAAPASATKASHTRIRSIYKTVLLAVNYGMEEETLARKTGLHKIEARELLRLHRQTYPRFWEWQTSILDYASLMGRLFTVFDWGLWVDRLNRPRSLRNFPMQANGAEMLRLACSLLTERGIAVCAPVHDALLIEAPLAELDAVVAQAQALMAQASATVLAGFELRTEAKIIRYPDCFEANSEMWKLIRELMSETESSLVGVHSDTTWSSRHATA